MLGQVPSRGGNSNMSLADMLAKLPDPYDVRARLYPALLTLFPAMTAVSIAYESLAVRLSSLLLLAGSIGGLYLLATLAREFGERLEPRLFKLWGGIPTTQLLRHRDTLLEPETKRRYHKFLSAAISTKLPTAKQEKGDPDAADGIYKSSVRWLRDHTRDKTRFGLVFGENVSYGFRRNMLALKPVGVAICAACILVVLVNDGVLNFRASPLINSSAVKAIPETHGFVIAIEVVFAVIWIAFINKNYVRRAAFNYAETLLQACEMLAEDKQQE